MPIDTDGTVGRLLDLQRRLGRLQVQFDLCRARAERAETALSYFHYEQILDLPNGDQIEINLGDPVDGHEAARAIEEFVENHNEERGHG